MANLAPKESISAFAAISAAQQLAFAPMIFQATLSLRDLGILSALDQQAPLSVAQIAATCQLSEYAVTVLLEVGVQVGLVLQQQQHYYLGKVGHFVLHDRMTRVNMDFSAHVCYQGMAQLTESLVQGKPCGLSALGPWPSIYPALSQLPQPAKDSWFAFDHFYSDGAFSAALPKIFAHKPKRLFDVGGNTGKWARRCVVYDADVVVTIVDLPSQIAQAQQQNLEAGVSSRIDTYALDVLSAAPWPQGADLWWMSQFLDCFSPAQIVDILQRIRAVMAADARVAILELFSDRQPFAAGQLSVSASSLYFTALANGNSRFYAYGEFIGLIEQAGFELVEQHEPLGVGHTLLILKAKEPR